MLPFSYLTTYIAVQDDPFWTVHVFDNHIKSLRTDQSVVILPADKGNATVVMERSDYNQKIDSLLNAPTYSRLKRDPTRKFERRVQQSLKALTDRGELGPDSYRRLNPSHTHPPYLYGLPKIHKPDVPLRPIVSTVGSPTYALAKHLAKIISPLAGKTSSHVRNSAHFAELIKGLSLTDRDIMVSFDVSSLFTNVPIDEALDIVQQRLEQDSTLPDRTSLTVTSLMDLLRLCLQTTYFAQGDNLYQQDEGAAMGSPLSPIIANIYMEFFEELPLESTDVRPSLWLRYVDDTFIIWSHGAETLPTFLQHLNSVRPTIQFTMEKEVEGALPFLDVRVSRDGESNTLVTRVYRKPTHTDRYLHYRSYHPPAVKNGIIRTLLHRSRNICQDTTTLNQELAHLTTVFQRNGYPRPLIRRALPTPTNRDRPEPKATVSIPFVKGVSERIKRICAKSGIRVYFRANRTLGSLLSNIRPKRDPHDTKGVIYQIPCLDCDRSYIGETGRTLKTRLTEHRRNCRNGDVQRSGVAQHSIEDDYQIDWKESVVIDREMNLYRRRVKEALYIRKFPNFNQDQGLIVSPIWSGVIH